MRNRLLPIGIVCVLSLASCAATERSSIAQSGDARAYRGWYMAHGSVSTFQPCGQSTQWPIAQSGDLAARAKAFDLQPDTPVYVRVSGYTKAGVLNVSRVDQFGSPEPVRDCAMTGVVLPTPSG